MNILSFSKKYLYKYKYTLLITVSFCIFKWIVNICSTYATGTYLDILITDISKSKIYIFSAIIFLFSLFNIIIGYISNILIAKLQVNMVFDINLDILKYVKKLPIKFFKNIDSVYLNQRINSDSNTIVNFLISIFSQLFVQLIISLVVVFILFDKSIIFSIVILFSLPIYIILYLIFEKQIYITNLNYKEEQNILFSSMHKQLSNIHFIKLNSLFSILDSELIEQYPKFYTALKKSIKSSYCFGSIGNIISNIFNVFLFLYGGISIYYNKFSVGDFIIIKNYYDLLLQTTINFTSILKSYPDAKVSYDRVFEILETNLETNGNIKLDNINSIELKNVSIKFDNKIILGNLNYKFEKGNVYLIKGNNGVGKSTMLKVILGLYIDDFKGEINYNGFNIKDLNLYDIREEQISFLDQEPLLLHSDLYKNITNIEIDNKKESEITSLIKEFNLKEKVNDDIKSSSKNLSGGEKQKISLIRCILKNPDVIIMDEPTSALDLHTISILFDKIKAIKSNKIIIIVSHDKKLDTIADKLIYLT